MNVTVTAFQRGAFQQNGFQIADVGPLGSGDWLTWMRIAEEGARIKREREREPVDEPVVVLEATRARDYPIITDLTPAPTTMLALRTRKERDDGVEAFHAFMLEMLAAEGNA